MTSFSFYNLPLDVAYGNIRRLSTQDNDGNADPLRDTRKRDKHGAIRTHAAFNDEASRPYQIR